MTSWETVVSSQPDSTFDQGGYSDADLGKFLERPVKIAIYSWTVGAAINDVLDPWTLFFTHPAVAKRIDNFNLLRCTLNVKYMINGTPFHYGRAMVSYAPFAVYDDVTKVVIGNDINLMHYSQRPKIFLDPCLSQGGTIRLPFLHLDNWIAVSTATAISEMGKLRIDSFGTLEHANLGSDNVNISVFAWASDVKLCVPTLSLSAQGDEYGQGIISRPANIIAKVSGILANVPVIGPFALATNVVAKAVSSVASFFGFSRPVILTPKQYVKNIIYGNLANCDEHETVNKLTMDSKQELTIDSRTVGLSGIDEMTVNSIAKRESYLTTFAWSMLASADTLLYNVRVQPSLGGTAGGLWHLTPVCFASQPFENWSGTIVFRFQIICSNFHRGRIRIAYDPTSSAIATTSDSYNVAYTRVIDIADEKDFEVSVSWAQPQAYKKIATHANFSLGSATAYSLNDVFDNGLLSVWILNELTAPTDASDITVNVFCRAGDDFELNNPISENIEEFSYFVAQGDEMTSKENSPETSDSIEGIGEIFNENKKNFVFFGESVVSFRTLLKRYNVLYTTKPNVYALSDRVNTFRTSHKIFPMYFGADPNGVHLTSLADPYNYTHNTLINWLTPCYVARRGGVRYKYQTYNTGGVILGSTAYRTTSITPYETALNALTHAGTSVSHTARQGTLFKDMMLGGGFTTDNTVQPGVEVEYPFYSSHRFALARSLNSNQGLLRDETISMTGNHVITIDCNNAEASLDTYTDVYVSIAEDFNLMFFLDVPAMELVTTTPLPSLVLT
jgi:hypothetical protein